MSLESSIEDGSVDVVHTAGLWPHVCMTYVARSVEFVRVRGLECVNKDRAIGGSTICTITSLDLLWALARI